MPCVLLVLVGNYFWSTGESCKCPLRQMYKFQDPPLTGTTLNPSHLTSVEVQAVISRLTAPAQQPQQLTAMLSALVFGSGLVSNT